MSGDFFLQKFRLSIFFGKNNYFFSALVALVAAALFSGEIKLLDRVIIIGLPGSLGNVKPGDVRPDHLSFRPAFTCPISVLLNIIFSSLL